MHSVQNSRATTRDYTVGITDGILYMEFYNQLTLGSILAAEDAALRLITERNITVIPSIIRIDTVPGGHIKVAVTDFAKLFTSRQTVKHISAVYVVGADARARRLTAILNKLFFSGRIRCVSTLDEAKAAAEAAKPQISPILEQD